MMASAMMKKQTSNILNCHSDFNIPSEYSDLNLESQFNIVDETEKNERKRTNF